MPKEKVNYQEVYEVYELKLELAFKVQKLIPIRLKCDGSDGPRQ